MKPKKKVYVAIAHHFEQWTGSSEIGIDVDVAESTTKVHVIGVFVSRDKALKAADQYEANHVVVHHDAAYSDLGPIDYTVVCDADFNE